MATAALIGVDWGTSNFRAFLLDASGKILDRRAGPHGIMTVKDGRFGEVLSAQVGEWLAAKKLPVLMSGMIGSRQGWVEVPYVPTFARISDLADQLCRAPFKETDAYVVPGVSTRAGQGAFFQDVMRGEETQVFGALALFGIENGVFVLPGTHSKWVMAGSGGISGFSTYMTGEIFAAARDHTILGRLMEPGPFAEEAFLKGVRDGSYPGEAGSLLHRLFLVRTAGLFGQIPATDLADYLSGILIGAERRDATRWYDGKVDIIGTDALSERYSIAAKAWGQETPAEVLPSDCISLGYIGIARLAGLVP